MDYILEERDRAWVVRFDGDIGGADDKELKRLFVQLVQDRKVRVAADLSRVSFLDSTVLGTLVWGMKNLREAGGDLRLFGLHDFVRRLFAITQLDRAFRIADDEAHAVAGFD